MGRTVLRAFLIALLGAALGLVANAVSPRRIPYITPPKVELPSDYVSLDDAKQLWGSGEVFFLDARAPADYQAGHIAGAFSLPTEDFDTHYPAVAALLTPDAKIVAYCDGMECDLSHHLMDHLRELGYKNIHILQNGWTVWHAASFPTAKRGSAMKYLGRINLVLRVLVGGIFVVAGALKIEDPAAFADAVANFRVMPHAGIHLLAITLPWIELVAGLLLIAGIWKRANAFLITLMLIVFLAVIGQAIYRNINIKCGCFGSLEGRKVGVIALAEDMAMLLAAIWLTYWSKDEREVKI